MKPILGRLAVVASTLILIGCGTLAPPVSTSSPVIDAASALGSSGTATSRVVSASDAPTKVNPRDIANNCFVCHGPKGRSPAAISSLDRLNAEQLVAKLLRFKTGAETSTIMGRLTKAYTDAEIDAVAAYIADLNR